MLSSSSSFFSTTNPTPSEYENGVNLVAQATAQATAALASQEAAAASAQSAQGYSVSAGTSASTATTQASSASTSATNASNSATTAASSATAAQSSATAASSSASNAATSATNASNSATSASTSATNAQTAATNAANSATSAANSASSAAATLAVSLTKTANLSDLSNAATARSNLGVAIGSNVQAWDADLDAIAAISSTSGLLKKTAANTWSLDTTSYLSGTVGLASGGTGATDAAGARSNLGLGTAATAAATTFAQVANNLSDVANTTTARSNLGLGSAALLASSAVLQSANNLSDLGSNATARTNLGLGSVAIESTVPVAKGGTGLTSLTAGRIPFGNGTSAFGSSANLSWTGADFLIGTQTSGGRLTVARDTNGYVINAQGATGKFAYADYTSGSFFWNSNNTFYFGTDTANALILATNNTERMRITAGGSVLIGTSTAGASKLTIADDSIQINTAKTPASATATGTTGQVCWDSSYIYVCVGASQWKRAAIATW